MNFQSKEFFYSSMNGKSVQRENSVHIKNGKGTKSVKITEDGKTKVSTHKLTPTEVKSICNRQFIPGLFAPCYKQANSQTRKARSSKGTTRRTSKKKGSK
jgi:hypothetical protein